MPLWWKFSQWVRTQTEKLVHANWKSGKAEFIKNKSWCGKKCKHRAWMYVSCVHPSGLLGLWPKKKRVEMLQQLVETENEHKASQQVEKGCKVRFSWVWHDEMGWLAWSLHPGIQSISDRNSNMNNTLLQCDAVKLWYNAVIYGYKWCFRSSIFCLSRNSFRIFTRQKKKEQKNGEREQQAQFGKQSNTNCETENKNPSDISKHQMLSMSETQRNVYHDDGVGTRVVSNLKAFSHVGKGFCSQLMTQNVTANEWENFEHFYWDVTGWFSKKRSRNTFHWWWMRIPSSFS